MASESATMQCVVFCRCSQVTRRFSILWRSGHGNARVLRMEFRHWNDWITLAVSRIAHPVRAEETKAEEITSVMPIWRVVHWLLLAATVFGPVCLAERACSSRICTINCGCVCVERERQLGERARSGSLEHTTATYMIYTYECAFFSCNLSASRSALVCIARGSRVYQSCVWKEKEGKREKENETGNAELFYFAFLLFWMSHLHFRLVPGAWARAMYICPDTIIYCNFLRFIHGQHTQKHAHALAHSEDATFVFFFFFVLRRSNTDALSV